MSKKGVSLVAIILAIAFFSLLGYVALSMLSSIGEKSSRYNESEKAFYIAEAGLQVALRTLKENWDSWQNPANFPVGSVGGGTFSLSIVDDEDGDGNPALDSNRRIVVQSTGYYKQARRKINAYVNKFPGALDVALYLSDNGDFSGNTEIEGDIILTDPNAEITYSGSSEHAGQIYRDETDTIPSLDHMSYINLAKDNKLNGFANRPDGNYFRGDFSKKPDSLNGVIYIDTYPDGSPANVNLSGNFETEEGEGNPAVLIVIGNLKISGTINFEGLIYVTGTVEYEVGLFGNVKIKGELISSEEVRASGDVEIEYVESKVKTPTNLSLISGALSNKVYTSAWQERYN
ncbi:MAG: hypothetical protein NC920_02695 [Candidatus Omnitrophica bacterium]|nr:hypothetical protein [Candidatus Omnitrophota bacterium]